MKKYIAEFIRSLLLSFVLFCIVTVSLTTSPLLNSVGFAKHTFEAKNIKLTIGLEKSRIVKGEKVELRISIKNNHSQNIYLPYLQSDAFQGFQIEIRNEKGEEFNPSKNLLTDNSRDSRLFFEYLSGQESNQKLLLNAFYEFPVGSYTVLVVANFYTFNKSKKKQTVTLKSKTMFTVTSEDNK
jgi:hypothetical protein